MRLPSYKYALPWEVLAVTMSFCATVISFYHMGQHIFYNNNSWQIKSHVLMIISMVPVYSICSGVSLIGTMSEQYIAIPLTAFREFYESLVLVAFMQFIAEFWGGTVKLAGILDTDPLVMKTVFPSIVELANSKLRCILARIELYPNALLDLRVFPFTRMPGSHYVGWTYIGALQYVGVMWLYIAVMLTLWTMVLFSKIDASVVEKVDVGLKGIKGLSNLIAMYNLLILFEYLRESQNTHERMNKIRPISKFICIKLLVIFSLWQEALFSLLAKLAVLPAFRGYSVEWTDQQRTAKAVVNWLVCIEMLLFAWWHRYAYPCNEDWDLKPEDVPVEKLLISGEAYESRRPWFLQHNVLKMTDDVGYLLNNRVRGQFQVVHKLKEAKRSGNLDMEVEEEIRNNFHYFELDAQEEASLTQLQFLLAKSGFAKNWEDAENMLTQADSDGTKRIGVEELLTLLKDAERA